MGGCTGKSKKPEQSNQNQTGQQKKKQIDNPEMLIQNITVPQFTTLEEKIYYLSDKQLTELIQQAQTPKLVEKVVKDLKFQTNNQINQAVLDLYKKLNHKNDTIIRNVGTNGTMCLEILSNLKKTFDDVHAFIQNNQDFTNNQPQLAENQVQFLEILVVTYHIIMTLLDSSISDQRKAWINYYDINFKKLFDDYNANYQKFGLKNQVQNAQGQTAYYLTGLYDTMLKSLEVSSQKAQDQNNNNPKQQQNQLKPELQQQGKNTSAAEQKTNNKNQQQNQQKDQLQCDVENYLEVLWDHCINQAFHSENVTDDEETHQARDCRKYYNQVSLKKGL